tara:strand:+ start:681 stop:1568 length:888 start_codon:yes stop_codon:yes gene_type:complete
MVKICLACEKDDMKKAEAKKFFQVYNNRKKVSAKWALDYGFVNNVPPSGYKSLKANKHHQESKGNQLTLQLPLHYANHKFYAWSSQPTNNRTLFQSPPKSYGFHKKKHVMNDAFGMVRSNGTIQFRIQNPSIYMSKGKIYPPHIHYKVATKDGKGFTNDFFTMTYLPDITLTQTNKEMKKGLVVVLNALSYQYYAKHHLPGSYNLPVKVAAKMKEGELEQFMKDVLINYPKLQTMVQTKQIKLHHIPIITYCAHAKCSAAKSLSDELLKRNFVNIVHYADGINGYYMKKYGVKIH